MSVEVCEKYLENEPDAIYAYDLNGDTAIHYAAINRNMELLRVLVKFKVKCEKTFDEKKLSCKSTEQVPDDFCDRSLK
jgi:ankyrin repeat protein